MPIPARSSAAAPARRMAGERCSSARLRDEPRVVGVGAREREDPALLGHSRRPGRLGRAHDVARTLVDLQVGRAQLGVGERDHAVRRTGGDDLGRRARRADPGVGVAGGHLAEARPQRADARRVLLERPPVGGPERVLEERVGVNGQQHAAVDLEVGRARLVHPEHGRRRRALGRLLGPGQRCRAPVEARQGPGVHGLGPRDQDDVELAPADGQAGVVHQRLGRVAADRGQHELGGLVARREAEAGGHLQRRVDGVPPEGHDDADAVGPADQRVAGSGAPAGRRAVTVLGGRPQRAGHELDRLGPLCRVEVQVRGRDDLPHADDDGSAGVQRHGPWSVATAPGRLPEPARPVGRLGG